MIRVTVELLSARTGKQTTLGIMIICNDGTMSDGTGNSKRGNYIGHVYRKGTLPKFAHVQRGGHVENFPRRSYTVWRLILRMLRSMYPEEK